MSRVEALTTAQQLSKEFEAAQMAALEGDYGGININYLDRQLELLRKNNPFLQDDVQLSTLLTDLDEQIAAINRLINH